MRTLGLAAFGLLPLAAPAMSASATIEPKMIEIDEAGNITTKTGSEIGKPAPPSAPRERPNAIAPRDNNAGMSICDPKYRWSPAGVSPETVAGARRFYRDVTQPYEAIERRAHASGADADRQRQLQYWDAHKKFLDSVPRSERKIVQRGISPRLAWWCSAPPVIVR